MESKRRNVGACGTYSLTETAAVGCERLTKCVGFTAEGRASGAETWGAITVARIGEVTVKSAPETGV